MIVSSGNASQIISLKRDGGLESMEVNGVMQLLVSDPTFGKAVVPLNLGANPGFQVRLIKSGLTN